MTSNFYEDAFYMPELYQGIGWLEVGARIDDCRLKRQNTSVPQNKLSDSINHLSSIKRGQEFITSDPMNASTTFLSN